MNRTRVIVWMTVAVFVVLGWLGFHILGGWPPWPVTLCFAVSHVFFCVVVSRVRPFRGPYGEPMSERTVADWE